MEIICNVKSTEEFSSLNYIVSTHMISSIPSGCAQAIHNWKKMILAMKIILQKEYLPMLQMRHENVPMHGTGNGNIL